MLGLHPATISHHMSRLRAAGLVEARAESYYSVYKLRLDVIHALAKQLFSTTGLASVASGLDTDAYDKKVLNDFTAASGRLKTIPAQRKKRSVILRHIVRELKGGQKYSERQIRPFSDGKWSKRNYWPATAGSIGGSIPPARWRTWGDTILLSSDPGGSLLPRPQMAIVDPVDRTELTRRSVGLVAGTNQD